MKKVLALILALVMCLGILAGCEQKPAETSKPTEATKPTETQKPTETTAPTEPPVTEYTFPAGAQLDVYAGHSNAMDGTDLNDFIEEATGLDILWLTAGDGGIEALLTEKVTPSLIMNLGRQSINNYGRLGAYINLWDYQEIMPNFFKYFNSEEYASYKEAYMCSENELYCAPIYINGNTQLYGWIYRDDIFEELNLEVPTDWDSFVACLKAMKTAYPDSYPFTMRNMPAPLDPLREFAQQFGVDYATYSPSIDWKTGEFYNQFSTDEMRDFLRKMNYLVDEGLMDIASLGYWTAEWQEDLAKGRAFITYDKAFQLDNIMPAGQQLDPDYSLSWFNAIPMVESDLPYAARDKSIQNYNWTISSRCADVELACRYLDWLYSDEGIEIMSWGKKGVSYDIDAEGNKYYIEGFDKTYMARYQESGYIDFNATLVSYKYDATKEMVLGTMEATEAAGFKDVPVVTFNAEEQTVIDTYQQGMLDTGYQWLQQYMLGQKDIEDDTLWQKFKDELAAQHIDEVCAAWTSAYARQLAEEGK